MRVAFCNNFVILCILESWLQFICLLLSACVLLTEFKFDTKTQKKIYVKTKYKLYLLLIFIILTTSLSYAQPESKAIRLGIDYGIGKQQIFPYNSRDYKYDVRGYTVLLNWPFKKTRVFSFELQLNPGIYFAKHRLLEALFMQPADGPDYLEKRERFMKEKTITEYVLNAGFLIRYNLKESLSFYILTGTGPMFSDTETERLARGFAFSDIAAIGCAYKTGKIMFEIRSGIRHVSNLDLKWPNSGHNSSNIDFGVSIFL